MVSKIDGISRGLDEEVEYQDFFLLYKFTDYTHSRRMAFSLGEVHSKYTNFCLSNSFCAVDLLQAVILLWTILL